ncbi:MAG: ABC transporter permease [Gemmatimonadota bacterium]
MSFLPMSIRHAGRRLARSPLFFVATVATLALGIGANTAIFSVVNAVLLRPLPYPQPDRLVRVWEGTSGHGTVSPPNFVDFRSLTGVFQDAAAHYNTGLTLTGEGNAEQLTGVAATPSLFPILGAQAEIGRVFQPDEAMPGNARVVILSDALWRRRFGGDPSVLGRAIRLDGEGYRVVGVMPAGFDYPEGAELWIPAAFTTRELATQRGAHYLTVLARLRPGVTLDQANTQAQTLASRLEKEYPHTNTGMRARVVGLRDDMVGDYRRALFVLAGAVGLVLLIACANVANLFMVRAVGRDRELAVQTALGARRWHLVRELFAESLLLASAGGLLGVVVATWITGGLVALQSSTVPRLGQVHLDGTVLAFTAGLTLLTGLLFGTLPALHASRHRDLGERLKTGRGQSEGHGSNRLRGAFIVGELALALVLLAGAGLLGRSFLNLHRVNLGFRTDHVLTFSVSLPDNTYSEPARRRQFGRQLVQALDGVPGVRQAGLGFGLPLSGLNYWISVERIDGQPGYRTPEEEKDVQVRVVTPGYLRVLGVPLRSGRLFTDADRDGTKPVVLVNETAAKLLFPDQDPLGHTFEIGTHLHNPERLHGEVVGVIADTKYYGPASPARAEAYFLFDQFPVDAMSATLRTDGDPASVVGAVRQRLSEIDPDVPMFRVRTMDQLLGDKLTQPRFYTLLLALFGGLALLLAAIGVYGVIAYAVGRRTREIGIRMALGADRGAVVAMIVRQVVWLSGAGVVLGFVGSLVFTRLMRDMLFNLSPTDPASIAAATAFLAAAAFLAGWLPARRASQVDPVSALRRE